MNGYGRLRPVDEHVELGGLLANTVSAVVSAQEQLDAYTERRQEAFDSAKAGETVLPPLWYTFSAVDIEMELAASMSRAEGDGGTRLMARTLDPASVGLYGYRASAGLRVRVRVEPQGFAQVKPPTPAEEDGDG